MKKGFTLIELLAVIVILAIIALIATPIILGIINDAREKANERSVELYASAVRNAVAAYQLTGTSTPKSFDDLTIQYEGDVKCTVQELYEDGSFYLEGCKVNNGEKEYSYGTKQGTTIEVGTIGICNPISVATEGTYTAGDKYECDVDPNKDGYDQIFYVLTNATSGSVNLIMDSNINISGTAVKEGVSDMGFVAWINNDYFLEAGGDQIDWDNYENMNVYGPITAMTYLQTATSSWTNVNAQTISTFNDDAGETHEMAQTFTTNARLPFYSEISDVSSSKLYLIDYLYGDEDADYGITGRNGVSDVCGYWTLSSVSSSSSLAWYVDYDGSAYDSIVDNDGYGARPVINLSI